MLNELKENEYLMNNKKEKLLDNNDANYKV